MSIEKAYNNEIKALEEQLASGEITDREFNKTVKDMGREYNHHCQSDADYFEADIERYGHF